MTTRGAERTDPRLAIAARLRQERLLAAISQEELARALGTSVDAIGDYETGRKAIAPRELVASATLFGIPLSFFCARDDQHSSMFLDEAAAHPQWLALSRPSTVLSWSSFARVDPLIQLWRETRGRLTDDVQAALVAGNVLHRTYLVRPSAGFAHLITEYCAPGVAFLLPCESLAMVGREFHEIPDRRYGARMAEGYMETACVRQLRIDAIRAQMRTSSGTVVRGRYDRVLIPWRHRGGALFVMGVSLRRELSIIS